MCSDDVTTFLPSISDKQLLNALPCILSDEKEIWFDSIQGRVSTFEEF